MLLLRLATSKQAPDAPTLISSSSSPADVKPKIVKAQSQTTPLSSQTQATPSPGAGLAGADNGGGGGLQPPAECGVGTSCGNIAAARLLDLGKKLIEATRAGRVEQVRHLVESSGAPFTSDSLGTTALHVAAQYGYADIAEILVRGGVNRDARTKLERTALHLAAQSGSLDIVDLLVSHGSDVNARDMLRMTPLHWAVERGHVVVAERLLIAGADAESSNKFLLSPLDIARESGSSQMIELFKNWTGDQRDGQSLAAAFAKSSSAFAADANGSAGAPNDLLDFDYRLAFVDGAANSRNNSLLDNEESCIDLVGLEWNKCEFDPSFLLSGENDDEPKVEYLMKVVEELQKENQQLRQKVDQLSTVEP